MQKRFNKKGLSPIIATVLLITLALILAVIIFLWARSFVGEKIEKFGTGIEMACDDIFFEAEVFANTFGGDIDNLEVHVVNRGSVPLYGVRLAGVGKGSVKDVGENFEHTIDVGETQSVIVDDVKEKIKPTDSVRVLPVILGESQNSKKSFVCPENYGVESEILEL